MVSSGTGADLENTMVDINYTYAIENARELVVKFLNETENKFAPGLVIGVSAGGEQKWIEGFGLANIENNVTMTGDAVMQIGSISKSFTVGLAARLVQEAKLDFAVPIRTYLSPDKFPDKTWNGSVVNITLRQLLQMTGGIPNGPSQLEVGKCLRCLKQTDRLIFMRDKGLEFVPGTKFDYSNFGYELAGAVIESVLENRTFDEAMTEMIQTVIKLNKTGIVNTQLITPHLASFYTTDMKSVSNSGMWGDIYLNDLHAAGGITATISDVLTYGQTWLDAYHGRSEYFLKKSIANEAWTPSDVSGTSPTPYGMGWVIQNVNGDRQSGSRVVWHNGGTIGCRAIIAIYPETEIIVAASVNLGQSTVDQFVLKGTIADLFAKNNCLSWYGNEKTRIHVLSMEDGTHHPITYEAPAMFTFHHINAYEEDGHIVCDVAAYNDANVVTSAGYSNMKNQKNSVVGATARRYILPLTIPSTAQVGDNIVTLSGSKATAIVRAIGKENVIDITPQDLSEGWIELPRINYKLNGQRYNFAYGLTTIKDNVVSTGLPDPDQISKIDIAKGTETKYFVEKGIAISEPVFVANPKGTEEDDGVLIAALLYKAEHRDVKLVVINAKDMKEIGSVFFRAEGTVTATFHGQWHSKDARVQIN